MIYDNMKEEEAENELQTYFQELSNSFDELCQTRHEEGAKEYGVLTFAGNDVIRMMMEELADASNYMRYQFIKLMVLQGALEEELAERGISEIPFKGMTASFQGFKGTGEFGWKKS